ncbi:ABC transporter permease [Knoellia sp. CPCC 206435]|uniref:ABC transporter permease n=1 Tax=Knoellia terrae TaxID=3404797 RepID=UPI003B43C68D
MKSWRSKILWEIWLPAVLVALWWFTSANSTSFYFPPLSTILTEFRALWIFENVPTQIVPSLVRLAAGFAIAVVGGVALGLLLGSVRWLEEATRPIIEFLRATPGVAVLPIMMLILGIGTSMKIGIIALVSAWPILLNTIDGVRSVEPVLRDVSRSYRLSRWDRIRYITLPTAMPQIFAGARTALAIGVVAMVISEMVGTPGGMGYFILSSQREFNIPAMWTGIIALGIVGYLLNKLFGLVENRVLSWHKGMMSHHEGAGS